MSCTVRAQGRLQLLSSWAFSVVLEPIMAHCHGDALETATCCLEMAFHLSQVLFTWSSPNCQLEDKSFGGTEWTLPVFVTVVCGQCCSGYKATRKKWEGLAWSWCFLVGSLPTIPECSRESESRRGWKAGMDSMMNLGKEKRLTVFCASLT